MRKPKTKRTELIHLLENTWKDSKKGQDIQTDKQREVIIALNCTLFYLELLDKIRGENHKIYFMKRHLSTSNNMSQIQISNVFGVCRDSISVYCAMYIDIFEYCLERVREFMLCIPPKEKEQGQLLNGITRYMVQNRKK